PGAELFREGGPATERDFIVELRQIVLNSLDTPTAEIAIDLETLSEAVPEFTVIERQIVWLEAIGYDNPTTAKMMNVDAETVESGRNRAEEALRTKMDRWRRGMIRENGRALTQLAEAAATPECLPSSAFIDAIDGRITWMSKKDYEFHMMKCWRCVDHFCRIREADDVVRREKPLEAAQAAPLLERFGIPQEKKPLWRRLLAKES